VVDPSHPSQTLPCSLVRGGLTGGQTSPHTPRLVESHNKCPPLSLSPPREHLCGEGIFCKKRVPVVTKRNLNSLFAHRCLVWTTERHDVSSQHSASQDTLRDCTKCRGILACARSKALSRTESDEASSRSCCAQLTI